MSTRVDDTRSTNLRATLRDKGLRATPCRLAVFDLLRAADVPMSHGDVADRLALESWDRATIYRNLTDLAEAGLARRIDVGDHVWRFEMVRGDHGAGTHVYFVCTECGSIECLPQLSLDGRIDGGLGGRRARIPRAIRQGQVEVHVRGLCDGCS